MSASKPSERAEIGPLRADRGRHPAEPARPLRIACGALHYFAYWQTPLDQHKRWSTRFFLAETPAGQDAAHDGSEVTDIRWITAQQALDAARDRSMKFPLPTIRNLKDMNHAHLVVDLVAWAKQNQCEGIVKLRPIFVEHDGKMNWFVWGDEGYPFDEPQ